MDPEFVITRKHPVLHLIQECHAKAWYLYHPDSTLVI